MSSIFVILLSVGLAFHASESFADQSTVGGHAVTDARISAATIVVNDRCTGFMIDPQFAITARHCGTPNGSSVLLGAGKCNVTQVYDVPNSDPTAFVDDVTLLKVSCPAGLTDHLKVFDLPVQDEVQEGSVQIAGYGKEDGTGILYPGLLQIQATLTDDYDGLQKKSSKEIAKWFPDFYANAEAGLYLCMTEVPWHVEYHGDSGGPTYVVTSNGFKAVSVNSFSLYDDQIAGAELSMIYGTCGPRLSHYTNWILDTMAKDLNAS